MNIVSVFKQEVTRLARKVVKQEVASLREALSSQKRQLVKLRSEVSELERQLRQMSRQNAPTPKEAPSSASERAPRFSADLARKRRVKLKLSQAEFGLLIGVSAQTIYNYERGVSAPKGEHLHAFQAAGMSGRRAALARIAEAGAK